MKPIQSGGYNSSMSLLSNILILFVSSLFVIKLWKFQLFTDHGRDITGPGFTLDHCLHPELGDSVAKFLKKQSFGNTTVYQGTLPRQTGFRRTVSQVSLSINRFANGLGRMTASRSNLRNISENSPIVSMSPRPSEDDNHNGSVNTPKRGLRSRLTSSTFVNRALLRRNSVRGGQDIAREDNNKENQTAGY
uniref:Transmembrane protein n=1 Tax=Heterorhabditis bacteriophora TaxID=37862 RepID=A0A1I7WPG8_HETBA